MKKISSYLILLIITTACAANSINISANVSSWEDVEPEVLNQRVQQAYKSNLEWADKPELYVFNLFELSNLKNILYKFNADNIENPIYLTITIARDGFLDDSVRGDIQELKLVKDKNGLWNIVAIRKAISCWRREKPIFSSEACP